MTSKNKKVHYETYTLGNSPAAVYLIDILNKTENNKDHNVISHINEFKRMFKQLTKAYDNNHIDKNVVYSFIKGKRLEIVQNSKNFLDNGYTPLVVTLYQNLMLADMKHFDRKSVKLTSIQISAVSRAKALLKNKGTTANKVSVNTFGKINGNYPAQLDGVVVFNEHGIPEAQFDKDAIKDDVTNESLMNKSLTRLKRLGKHPYSN